jgi:hypothetical protein
MLIKLLFDIIQYEFLLPSDFADGVHVVIFMRIFMIFFYIRRVLPPGICAFCVVCAEPE